MDVAILTSDPQPTVLRVRFSAGVEVAGRHVHREHVDMFHVLEEALTVELGPDAERIVVSAGTSIAIQPGVEHTVRNDSDADVVCINVHAPDGGFAGFIRGMRDGSPADWDFHPVE